MGSPVAGWASVLSLDFSRLQPQPARCVFKCRPCDGPDHTIVANAVVSLEPADCAAGGVAEYAINRKIEAFFGQSRLKALDGGTFVSARKLACLTTSSRRRFGGVFF